MKNKILRPLTCFFLVLSATTLLRADRDADRRNERIPTGHEMHPPRHQSIVPLASSSGPTGYTPQQLRHAYGFDQLDTTGQGQVIAIIDAYGSPTIQADLNTFCAAFGLPSTTVQVYYPQGTPGTDPTYPDWALETSLDVEWAHAIAPDATIIVVAAQIPTTTDLFAAVDYAVSLGATQVSMSWGGAEYSTEGTSDFHFNVPGVTFLASSGDSGAGAQSPACSPYVVGVGGTSLHLDSSANIVSETAWSGSGGGASLYEPVPSYQTGWWIGTTRGIPDVAYDADPNTGVPVYLTGPGWGQWGGTSMSAPQWAALFALANSLRSQSISSAPDVLYSLASANYSGYYRDIISGSNGLYSAGPSYDLVTGLGAPLANQLVVALAGGFSSQVAAPVFFPPAGTYFNGGTQNVTFVSATPGASIRYTTDGSTPTETYGMPYSSPVSISAATTLTAIACESGLTDSPVTSGNYTFLLQAAAPTFSPGSGSYLNAQTVTISTTTGGATIRYTINGSTPSETNGTIYTGTPVTISSTATLNAIAYESGFIDSPVTSGFYTITPPAAAPVFSPAAGTYATTQTVTITSTTSGASIRYTTDGSTPSETTGTPYSGPVSIGTTTTLSAIAYASGVLDSQVTSGTYYIVPPAAAPVFSPAPGAYATAQTVTITSATIGATIRYTTDGSTPAETNGMLYLGPVNVGSTTVLKAIAYESSLFADSPVTSGFYTIISSPATILNVIYNFTPSNNGGTNPEAALVQGSDGNFYGTTAYGGNGNDGTVFKLTPAGVLTTLAFFNGPNGANPGAALVQDGDGNFFGTTRSGGSTNDGTVFKLTPAGSLTTLVSFNFTNGDYPNAGLLLGRDGSFYGTTKSGGSGLYGTVFKMTPAGVLTTLVSFNGANGEEPDAALFQGSNGIFYGTTEFGGSANDGTVFRVTPAGILTTLVSFIGANGAEPFGDSLVQGSDGNFYGATSYGGSANDGTIFKMTPAGSLTTLLSFNSANGAGPSTGGLAQGIDGNFYGTTEFGGSRNAGTVFKMTPTGILTTLVSLTSANGISPYGSLVLGSDGNFYGTTQIGGVNRGSPGNGVVFQLILPSSQVAAPAFNPPAGIYPSAQTVTISTPTSGASIRFTTDGSTPTETNGTLYNGTPVNIYSTTTLQAIAYETGLTDSPITSGTYAIGPQVAAPAFNPPAGIYPSAQTVTISTPTSGASIRFTTDGSTPTETNGTIYNNVPVSIGSTTNLQAIAYESGFTDSSIASAIYTIVLPAAAPVFSPAAGTYTSAQAVTITSATSGATIRYTTDGSTPTETNGTPYANVPVTIGTTTTLQAIAYESGFTDSPVTSATYTIVPPAAAPVFSPAAGTYTTAQAVTITSATSSATIRYTTDGSTPTESNGTVYNNVPVNITSATTLQAMAYASGFTDSSVATAIYTIDLPPAAAPVFSPAAGTYTSAQAVSMTSATSGAMIHYTTDGSTPTEFNGTLYTNVPVAISSTTTLQAIAYENGFADSSVTTATYTINLPPVAAPTFSPAAGIYSSAQKVTIKSATSGATIHYTTDGSTPTETNGTLYSGPVSLSTTVMLKAIAYGKGFSDSPVANGLYTFTSSPATSVNVVYNLTSSNDVGINPVAALVQGSDGNFYGTTPNGGSRNAGAVFKLSPAGVLTTLVSFNGANGAAPLAGLVQGSDGNFYGTTQSGGSGGYGTVFELTPAGLLTTLASFNSANGAFPSGGLVQGSDGNFYGTTEGGVGGNNGTIFKLTPAGVLTTLALFNDTNGANPCAALVQGTDGNLYGTTLAGGSINEGTVFKMNSAGVLTTLVSFNVTNGANPCAALVQGTDGNLYGTTLAGGSINEGTVFKMNSAGVLTTLVSFNVTNGALPYAGLVQGSDGNFYGTTSSGGIGGVGTIFRLTPAGALTTLVSFDGANGAQPEAALVRGFDGDFYGTAYAGGSSNDGVIFQLIIPQIPAPIFTPAPGTYTSPQSVTISTTFNGASIRYTTDGSAPTETHGTAYSKAVSLTATTTLKAIAYKSGLTDSAVVSSTYTLQVAVPVFSPAGGTYTHVQTVAITSATGSATIRYTTDGSTPTETHGTAYSSAVSINSNTTLNAIAYKSGFTDSAVVSATYTINLPPTLNFEAESLSYTPHGATASVQTDPNSSGGKWMELAATGTGQYINFTVPSVPAGTYQLKMEWKGNNSRGILQLSVDGTNLGGTLDQYASGQTYPTTTFGIVTFSSAGNHTIRLTVTGKNKSSSNYQLSADKFTLVGQ